MSLQNVITNQIVIEPDSTRRSFTGFYPAVNTAVLQPCAAGGVGDRTARGSRLAGRKSKQHPGDPRTPFFWKSSLLLTYPKNTRDRKNALDGSRTCPHRC